MVEREPCPDRIVDDAGAAFAMGAVGGSVWYTYKGLKDAPKGQRISSAYLNFRRRAPILGGNFAIWGGLFSAFDCAFVALRKKEDPWNAIGAGTLTGGVLALRSGPGSALRSAIVGGFLIGIIEGVSLLANKVFSSMYKPIAPVIPLEVQQQQQQQQRSQQR